MEVHVESAIKAFREGFPSIRSKKGAWAELNLASISAPARLDSTLHTRLFHSLGFVMFVCPPLD